MFTASIASVVYVVDSDQSVREGISRLLASSGMQSKSCDSIEAFLQEAPGRGACVLMDVGGPCLRQSGFRSRLRARTQGLPLIALAADDDPETRRRAREVGAQAFFRKPVDAAALVDSIVWLTHGEAFGR